MSLVATAPAKIESAPGSIAGLARCLASPWLGVALAGAAVAGQSLGHQNGDNSWLLTVAEKTLDGARPYIDVIESNPPGAFLFYAPAVAFARLVHVSAESAAVGFVFLLAGLSILLTGRILTKAALLEQAERGFFLNAAIFALVFLPGFSFAEREHNACLLILPALAAFAARASGGRVALPDAIAAGLAAGLTVAIKPYFALPLALPFLFALVRRRSPALLWAPEQLAALLAIAIDVAVLALVFPDWFNLAPEAFDVYLPMKEPWFDLLTETWLLFNIGLLAGLPLAFGRDCLAPRVAVPALASIGFMGTFFIQGKGWVNHGLPGDELAFLAIAGAIAPIVCASEEAREAGWARIRRAVLFVFMPILLAAPILFGDFLPLTGFEEYKGLTAAVLRDAPPHPKIIAISPRLDVGHPLTRRVGGQWVGRPNALWLMVFSQMFLDAGWGDAAKRARLEAYVARDALGFREDVASGHPDVVLVVVDPRIEAAMRNPDIAAAMTDYARVETVSGIEVWTKRDKAPRL